MSDSWARVKCMFDTQESALDDPAPVPLERLEAQICELAGHLTAATCRFLVLLGDFDARRGWASWDMNSCAAWLSWKGQMSAGAAREHVRVASGSIWTTPSTPAWPTPGPSRNARHSATRQAGPWPRAADRASNREAAP